MPSTEQRSDDEMLAVTRRRADQLRASRTRRRLAGAGLIVVLLVAGSAIAVRARTDDAPTVYATDDSEAPAVEPVPAGWSPMSPSPLRGRAGAVSAWTGEEWLIWRGDGAFSDACGSVGGTLRCGEQAPTDGAAYDPATDSWRMLPPAPVADDQGDQLTYGGVWTGTELIVWGGPDGAGAAYDPVTDSWRPIAAAPISPRRSSSMVWTGSELIVVGGLEPGFAGLPDDPGELADAAAYDPAADAWRTVASPGSAGIHGGVVWCDGSLVLLDDLTDDRPSPASTAARYRPETDRWEPLPEAPVDEVWGAVCADRSVVVVGAVGRVTPAAASLDVEAGTWTSVGAPPLVNPPDLSLTWTGRDVVAVGSPMASQESRVTAASFDPVSGAWTTDPDPLLTARSGVAAVWTGDDLFVWGGAVYGGFTSEPLADGARYHPGSASAAGSPSSDPVTGSTDVGPGASLPPSQPEPGDTSTWDVDAAARPTSDATSFTALVTRMSCSSGATGRVLRPGVVMTETEVVVTFNAESLDPDQVYSCPVNDAVPYVVELGEPIGSRALVDGACTGGGQASTTTFCTDRSGVRWRPDDEGIRGGTSSVTGQMVSVGGPAGAGPDPAPGEVRVLDAQGRTIVTATTDQDGNFQLLVPNGSFRVFGRSATYQRGQEDCAAERDLVVLDRSVGGVTVLCQRG